MQSFEYNVRRTGDKTHPCGTPVVIDRSPDDTPLNRTNCYLWHKTFIIQMNICGLVFNLIILLAKRYGLMVLNTEEKSAIKIHP